LQKKCWRDDYLKLLIKSTGEVIEISRDKPIKASRVLRLIEEEKCIPEFSLVLVRDKKPITRFHTILPDDEVEVYEVGRTG
jgi:hypothetical protein